MRPALHVVTRGLFSLACWLGALAAFVLLYCWYLTGPNRPSGPWHLLLVFGIAIGATVVTALVTGAVFRFLIPARCPRCRGRMASSRERTVVYRCRACGYDYDTGWSVTSGGGGDTSGGGCGGGCGGGGDGGG